MGKNNNKKTIPAKNYILVLFLIIGGCLIALYSFNLYKLYKNEKLAQSYLMSSKTIQHEIQNLKELNSVLAEAPNEYFLYISYTGDKEVYELEKDLKKVINDYGLNDRVYFLNVTDIKEKDDYLEQINNSLGLKNEVSTVPIILFFIDNELVQNGIVVREDENIIQAGDFAKLLDQFEIKDTN